MRKILFICRHNKFRSKVGEAIFNKLNKNKTIVAESAGLIGSDNPTPKNVVNVLKERSYKVSRMDARRVDKNSINDYSVLIIVADNVDPKFFEDSFRGRVVWWKVSDCSEDDVEGITERVEDIEKRVKGFIDDI